MIGEIVTVCLMIAAACGEGADAAGCRDVQVCRSVPECHQVCEWVSTGAGYATPNKLAGVGVEKATNYVCKMICNQVQHCYSKQECSEHIYNHQSG